MIWIRNRKTGWFAGLTCLLMSTQSIGAGFEIPEQGARALSRGGAFSARADDPTALIHSPGMASRLKGTQLLYSHNFVWSHDSFERSPSSIPSDVELTKARSENLDPFFALGGSLAATSDFGTDNWVFGLSLYGPSSSGNKKFAQDSGQRYLLTDLEALMFYLGGSVAWGTDDFGLGGTFQWASLPKLNYALVVDGTLKETLHPYSSNFDMAASLEMKDPFALTAILGAWWSPTPAITLSLSGRPLPVEFNAKGNVSLNDIPGTEVTEQFDASLNDTNVEMDMVLPPTARLGMRWSQITGGEEVFDIELNLVYEGWSTIDVYDADLSGKVILTPKGSEQTGPSQPAVENDLQDVSIDKKWRDTMSARLGGTWTVDPNALQVSAGVYYEQGASPKNYTNLDFISLDRIGIGGGVTLPLGGEENPYSLTIAYSHVFESTVTVDELHGKVMQQRPINNCPDLCDGFSGVPANAGRFESGADLLGVSLTARL